MRRRLPQNGAGPGPKGALHAKKSQAEAEMRRRLPEKSEAEMRRRLPEKSEAEMRRRLPEKSEAEI